MFLKFSWHFCIYAFCIAPVQVQKIDLVHLVPFPSGSGMATHSTSSSWQDSCKTRTIAGASFWQIQVSVRRFYFSFWADRRSSLISSDSLLWGSKARCRFRNYGSKLPITYFFLRLEGIQQLQTQISVWISVIDFTGLAGRWFFQVGIRFCFYTVTLIMPRTVYFFLQHSPLQFQVCAVCQLSIDCGTSYIILCSSFSDAWLKP